MDYEAEIDKVIKQDINTHVVQPIKNGSGWKKTTFHTLGIEITADLRPRTVPKWFMAFVLKRIGHKDAADRILNGLVSIKKPEQKHVDVKA